MQVRGEDVARTGALQAVLAVVAGAGDDPPECLAAGPKLRQPGVVFEAHDRLRGAVDRHLAGGVLHEPLRTAARLEVENSGPDHLLARVRYVAVAQQLQSRAHGKDQDALVDGLAQRRSLLREVFGRDRHLDVLAAVEQHHVELAEVGRLALLDGRDLDGDAPPLRAPGNGDEISAVPSHVQQRRVQVGDSERTVIVLFGPAARLGVRAGGGFRLARGRGRGRDRFWRGRGGGHALARAGRGFRLARGRGRGRFWRGRERIGRLALAHTAQYLPVQPRRRISFRSSIRGV